MPPQPVPQPRVDTFVEDANTGVKRRRTEYSGTLWYGEPPALGRVRVFASQPMQDDTPVFLPDSLQYRRSELADGVVSCTVGIQALTSEGTHIVHASADWVDDPRTEDVCWIQVRLVVAGAAPLGVSYRVVAVCSTLAAPSDRVIDLRRR
jgi:hypothetical protein